MKRVVIAALGLMLAGIATAQAPGGPTFQADGTAKVPAFLLPPSALSSPEARAQQAMRGRMTMPMNRENARDIVANRKMVDGFLMSRVARMRDMYPVDVAEERIAGVPVRVVTPKGSAPIRDRVLINLHGGAFTVCWDACSLVESIPMAGMAGYRVVSVNYRMAPEAKHPAGVEDAAAVYRELLKTYKPSQIGVYGCSAGGALTAQLAAWLPRHGLPQAGAAGIFGAGGIRFQAGDSAYVAAAVDGSFPSPDRQGRAPDLSRGYFAGTPEDDPIIAAALHPDVMAKFPPTLLITGTRAMDMSPAIVTNSALLKAGVRSTLIVGEGMGHCYIYGANLPEARDAYAVMQRFFRETLH